MLKIAHRGYSDVYGDNNMNSFQKAYEEGFDVIEMDIQLNKANELVIHHDIYKNGLFVFQYIPIAELSQLKFNIICTV